MQRSILGRIVTPALAGVFCWVSAAAGADAPPASAPAVDAPPLEEMQRLVDRPDERVSVLSNGLRVILKAHRTAPVVTVRMYCQTGSIYEQEYLGSGMSHLFEHLLHSGATTTRSAEEAARILDDIGGNTNAYTNYDVTCYFINTTRDRMTTAIELLGDWITRPTFPQPAFEREWGIVQRELERDTDDPDTQLFETMMQTVYREHPVRFPIIGHQAIVQKLKKEDIVGYYQRMYVPDNILVTLVGDIDLDASLAAVMRQFQGFTRRRMPTIVLPEEPEMTSPRFASRRMKVEAAMASLAWPSIPMIHPDLYALDVLSYVLAMGDSSRLVRRVRDTGLAFGVDCSSWTPAWARGVFVVGLRTAPDKLDAAKAAVLEQVALLQKDLVSDEELVQAKKQKAAEHVFAMQKAENIGESLSLDFLAAGDIHFSRHYVDRIQAVTAEQLRDVAKRYLSPQRLATIQILPEGTPPGAEEKAAAARPEDTRLVTLDNGLRVLVRRDPTTPLVSIQAYSLGGVVMEDEKTSGLSRLAAELAARGTTTRSAEQIARFFDSRGASFETSSAANTISFRAQVLKGDFADAMELFADVVLNPTFPAQELEDLRPRQLDAIAQIDEVWRSELMAYFQKVFFASSPYRFPQVGRREVVSQATRGQVVAQYQRCVTAPNTVLAIFGDVDAAQAESLARRCFAKMGGTRPELPGVKSMPPERPRLFIKPKPPTRSAAGVAVGFPGMRVTDRDDVAAVAVLDTIMSGYRYPTGWLFNSLRGGTASFVYEVHAQNVTGPVPGYFGIYAACQPGDVKQVYEIMTAQLDKARRGAITEAELTQARTIIKTTEIMESQTSSERAAQAAADELYGLGHDYRERFRERIEKVTLDEVKAAAKKYLTVPTVAIVTPDVEAARALGIADVQTEKSE